MTRLEAAELVLAFGVALAFAIALGVLVMFVRFEIEARLRQRARGGTVDLTRRPA